MPILPAEPELYPPDLWDQPTLKPEAGLKWWCLHTKPRQEKATARHLRSRGLSYYLPLVIQESRTPGGRKIRSIVPLFTSYLFLLGDEQDRIESLKKNTLVKVLTVPDQTGLDRDLRQIHQMLSSGLTVVPEPSNPVGTLIRIVSGPLTGLVGVVVRRDKRDEFVASVHFLGRGASVELQDWQVERA